jgi:hypothetical protein
VGKRSCASHVGKKKDEGGRVTNMRAALRLHHGYAVAFRPPICAGLVRHAATSNAPPIATSVSEDEFRQSVAGGAAIRSIGEFGAPGLSMHAFWKRRGVTHDQLIDTLAGQADLRGGVWSDPETLNARLDALLQITAPLTLTQLMKRCPEAVTVRSDTIRAKYTALADALQGKADAKQLVAHRPSLLRRSPEYLSARVRAVSEALPRSDMPHVLMRMPRLLEVGQHELSRRSAAIRASYKPETIAGWSTKRAARLLATPSHRLERLAHVDGLNPSFRIAVPDVTLLRMKDTVYERRFVHSKNSRWRRRGLGSAGERLAPRHRPLGDAPPPLQGVNYLVWGRGMMARRRQLDHRVTAPGRGPGARASVGIDKAGARPGPRFIQ